MWLQEWCNEDFDSSLIERVLSFVESELSETRANQFKLLYVKYKVAVALFKQLYPIASNVTDQDCTKAFKEARK